MVNQLSISTVADMLRAKDSMRYLTNVVMLDNGRIRFPGHKGVSKTIRYCRIGKYTVWSIKHTCIYITDSAGGIVWISSNHKRAPFWRLANKLAPNFGISERESMRENFLMNDKLQFDVRGH